MPMCTERWRTISSPRSSEFTSGCVTRASHAARITKGRYVRLTPCLALNDSLAWSRNFTRWSTFTSTIVQARAEVWSEATMCCPISLRICETGTTSSSGPATAGWTATCAAGAGAGAAAGTSAVAGAALAAACAPPPSIAERMSFFVMRPPVPDPSICERSRPCSSASRRTSGERILDRGPRSGRSPAPPPAAGGAAGDGGAEAGSGEVALAAVASAPCAVAGSTAGISAAEPSVTASALSSFVPVSSSDSLVSCGAVSDGAASSPDVSPPPAPSSLTSARSVPTGTV